jgi:hypothetical protein
MTTPTIPSNTAARRATRAALAVGFLVAAAACAGPGASAAGPYTFTIHFDGKCPRDATMDVNRRNCTHFIGSADKDCAKVSRERNDVVEFVAEPRGAGEFEVYFDPFKRQPFRSKDGTEAGIALRIDPATPCTTYEFYVVSGECPVLGPRIIVQQ